MKAERSALALEETILSLRGEGKSLDIWGERGEKGWRFRLDGGEWRGRLRDVLNSLDPSCSALRPVALNPIFSRPILEWWESVSRRVRGVDRDAWERLLKWENPVFRATELIWNARRMVLISGAGLSVDSGLKDFRSRSGWWRGIDPRTVATVEALENNYDLFHEFYSARVLQLKEVIPHRGYHILADWE